MKLKLTPEEKLRGLARKLRDYDVPRLSLIPVLLDAASEIERLRKQVGEKDREVPELTEQQKAFHTGTAGKFPLPKK